MSGPVFGEAYTIKYPYQGGGKIATLAETVDKDYRQSNAYKGTQLVFCDMGTPSSDGFNIYHAIKQQLIQQHNIPPDQIQFIHDHDTKARREELFKKMNSGEVRILLGSTKKLGTGVNVQARIIAMHHVDIPWRPSDLEQRTGRGGRQGNFAARDFNNNIVRNYIYAVNRTLDAYQFNILSNKQKFISQIKNNSIDARKINEGSMDEDGGMNFGEYVALLSGNTDLLEKVKLEKKLTDIERNYEAFLKRKAEAEFHIGLITRDLQVTENALSRMTTDWKSIEELDMESTPLRIGERRLIDKKIAGELLLDAINKLNSPSTPKRYTKIAALADFDLVYDNQFFKVYVKGASGQVYHYADGRLNENPALAGRYVIDSIKRLPKIIASTQQSIDLNKNRILTYQKERQATFNDKELIKELKVQIEVLSDKVQNAFSAKDLNNIATSNEVFDASKPIHKLRTR